MASVKFGTVEKSTILLLVTIYFPLDLWQSAILLVAVFDLCRWSQCVRVSKQIASAMDKIGVSRGHGDVWGWKILDDLPPVDMDSTGLKPND